ncbi:hypothetical protein ACFQRB_19290 [Halobaculum litoreum]|uniref:Alpha/beta hydrolase family protein n=1 Tax=Halobaculum litoreum TaxID=3031998 RepID=A0ABD5XSB9_9EURY
MRHESLFRRLPHRDALLDRAFLAALRLLTRRRRYFRDGADSPPFEAHLEAVDADWPSVPPVGTCERPVETLAGSLRAAVSVRAWHGPDAPTLVWHHGGGEYPYDTIFEGAFPDPDAADANLVVVRAPGHDTRFGVQRVGATLSRYLATLAVAVAATEHVLETVDGRTVVAGYSLGGFVTNRHHVHHDTADAYVPLMAGTAHGEIFLTTVPAAPAARSRAGHLRKRLNFTDTWLERDHAHVHPVLGRHDRLNRYATQRASYSGVEPAVWPVGHLRGIGAYDRIRQSLDRHLNP